MATQSEVRQAVLELLTAQGRGGISMQAVAGRLRIDLSDESDNEQLTRQLRVMASRGEIIFTTVLGPQGGVVTLPD